MQLINFFLAFLLPLLALAQDTTVATSTSTRTITRTIHVSQVSTVTCTSSSSMSVAHNTSTIAVPTFTAPANVTTPIGTGGGVVPSTTGAAPSQTSSLGAAPALSASNVGLVGFIAVAIAALV